jgi:hypothetical protein
MKFAWSGGRNRRAVRAAIASLVAYSAWGCGGAPNAKPLSAEVAIGANAGAVDAANAPVPAPAGVVALGRARDYRQWVKLEQASPAVAYLKKTLIEAEEDALLEDWDLTQPVEFVAAFDRNFRRTPDPPAPPPKPETDEDEAPEGEGDDEEEAAQDAPEAEPADSTASHFLAAFSLPLTRYAPESYERLGFKRWTSNAYVRGKCLVTPALGSAKARLICGDHPDVTRHLYGYLARGLPLEPLSSAPMFVELRPGPLKELWGPARATAMRELTEDGGNTSRLLQELTLSVVKEVDAWVTSAETVRFEGRPNERGEFEASMTVALRSPHPWLVESSLAGAAKVTGAPSAFLNLPKNVDAAWYSHGMPAERIAVLQSALVNLAQTAFREYGPGDSLGAGMLSKKQAQTVDRLVPELISALDSPCIRAERAVVANIPTDSSELDAYVSAKQVKVVKPRQRAPVVPFDVIARATVGQYLVAVPSAARCTEFVEQSVDMLTTVLQALPPKAKRELPLGISVRKNVKLSGLPPATVTRFSLTKQALAQLMKELKSDGAGKRYYNLKAPDSAPNRWGAPQGPMVLSMIAVPGADPTGSDWLALGLDEKQLLQALLSATHPVPGQTLASRADLAPLLAQKPMSLSFQSFDAQNRLLALLVGPELGPALAGLSSVFHGTSLVTTTRIQQRGNVAEAGLSYFLSKEGLGAIRQILSWDLERVLDLVKRMESASGSDSPAKK